MVQVRANESMRAAFGLIKERAEILNEDGTLLGYFEPVESEEDAAYRKAALLFDPEEVRKAKSAEGPWRTTAEVLERLHSLEKS